MGTSAPTNKELTMNYKVLRETDENVVILPGAKVNGDVTFGPGCSVWYNAVIHDSH